MSRTYHDIFGTPVGDGDTILSAATQGSYVRIGKARIRPNSLGIEPVHSAPEPGRWGSTNKVQPTGSVVVVLRHANGKVPFHIFTSIFGGAEGTR